MEQEEAKKIAHEVSQWIQGACGDVAFGIYFSDIEPSFGKTMHNKCKMVKEEGGNWKDFLADEIYNDVIALSDLVGDHLYDSAKTNTDRIQIAKELVKIPHPALATVAKRFIKSRKAEMKEKV